MNRRTEHAEDRVAEQENSTVAQGVQLNQLSDQALLEVAQYFQTLAEPARLKLLNLLRQQEYSVGELAHACGFSVANASRHLSQLCQQGFIARESRGNSVYYCMADSGVEALCDLVCDSIARRVQQRVAAQQEFLR